MGPTDPDPAHIPAIRQSAFGTTLRGIESPLKNWKPGEIDFTIVRENNEGEYSNIGGRLYEGTEDEMAVQQTVFARRGVNRVLRFAFELARKRKKDLTSATKSNGVIHTMPSWDQCFRAMAAEYPDVRDCGDSGAGKDTHARYRGKRDDRELGEAIASRVSGA